MSKEQLLIDLQSKEDIIPDEYDGSYELVRTIVEAYSSLDDYSNVTYLDLDAIYLMAIGTWKLNSEKKKEKVNNTCLSEDEKKKVVQIIDKVWDNACYGKYVNKEVKDKPSVGMFGTGFMSFKGRTTDQCAQKFVALCVDLLRIDDDNCDTIYNRTESVINDSFWGMKAASASVVLHCLKPNVFPVLNGYMGKNSIFEALGINLVKESEIGSYISNCRKIREYRDSNLPFKNYRVMDLMTRELDKYGLGDDVSKRKQFNDFDHNIILYGPPGTGKTYNTVVYAVAIIENRELVDVEAEAKKDYSAVKDRYSSYMAMGQIAFTTFHQSYGYEEFIEGIKPEIDSTTNEISYKIKDGVFKTFCKNAEKPSIISSQFEFGENPNIWKVTIKDGTDNVIKKECFANGHVRIGYSRTDDAGKVFVNDIEKGDIVVSLKTRKTIDAIGVIISDEAYELEGVDSYKLCRDIQWIATGLDYDVCDINEGKMLNRPTVCGVPSMKVEDIIAVAKKNTELLDTTDIEKNDKPYVFIIDEINRGNISKIFGELITLIETTKRKGLPEEAKAILPYSEVEFGVPANVYIIGTMNTADRSIALMDTALRRRFSFVEMMPKSDVLRDIGLSSIQTSGMTLDIPRMLDVINKRIEFLFDREHTIGHAFFTALSEDGSIDALAKIFSKSIIPLLQEYFYEDYEKIQLVLGDNKKSLDDYKFIIKKKESASSIFNGNPELDAMNSYVINKDAFGKIESYIEIYKKLGDE